jgi:hypothetical protein
MTIRSYIVISCGLRALPADAADQIRSMGGALVGRARPMHQGIILGEREGEAPSTTRIDKATA